jgi:hypothetical protein
MEGLYENVCNHETEQGLYYARLRLPDIMSSGHLQAWMHLIVT